MVRVAVLGATGYTARELLIRLVNHDGVDIVALTSRQPDPIPVTQSHPMLQDRINMAFENLPPEEVAQRGRVCLQLPAPRCQCGDSRQVTGA